VEGSDAIESLELRVLRAGAISGRVTDEFGDPIALARITVLELLPGGRQRPTSGRGNASQTDDQGRFRVFGLEPGEYAVLAEMAPAPSGGATRPLPTYHPGTADFAEARTIELDEGQDAADADITIVRGRVLTVRGTVIDSQGRPAPDAFVSFMRSTARGGATSANVSVQRDGAFAVRDLVPAEYTVVARRRAGNASEFATVPLSVQGDGVRDDGLRSLAAAPGRVGTVHPVRPDRHRGADPGHREHDGPGEAGRRVRAVESVRATAAASFGAAGLAREGRDARGAGRHRSADGVPHR
jgi:hypothetical protein